MKKNEIDFISHMVQMKATSLTPPQGVYHFISHMVQMKDRIKKGGRYGRDRLYIPHGSDERRHK